MDRWQGFFFETAFRGLILLKFVYQGAIAGSSGLRVRVSCHAYATTSFCARFFRSTQWFNDQECGITVLVLGTRARKHSVCHKQGQVGYGMKTAITTCRRLDLAVDVGWYRSFAVIFIIVGVMCAWTLISATRVARTHGKSERYLWQV